MLHRVDRTDGAIRQLRCGIDRSVVLGYNGHMARDWTLKFGELSDNERFIREAARALSPGEGLAALEELRRAHYDDPENPPGLERVFVLSSGPRSALRGGGSVRPGDTG